MAVTVSVGMPVYNGEAYLAAAIESILRQTFTDFELVISDNASTDATEQICMRYALSDNRVRYVRQPGNIGAAANYNVVFSMCRGEYIKWAAHDDLIGPDFLASCVAALDADPNVILAAPATAMIDETGATLAFSAEQGGMVDRGGICWPATPERNGALASADPVERFEALVYHTHLCAEIFGLMRRSALIGSSLHGSYLGSDKILLAELATRGRFWLGREPMFFRRCHAQQYSVAGKSDAFRAEWFGGAGFLHRLSVQKVIFFLGYARAIMKGSLTGPQRLACFGTVIGRMLQRVKARLGGGDHAALDGLYPVVVGAAPDLSGRTAEPLAQRRQGAAQ